MTNDDGVASRGLHVLARALTEAGHDVIVVAPTSERSGASASIGLLHRSGPLPVTAHDARDLGRDVYAIDAPPAGIVYAACLGAFGPAPDLVASGINPGPNTGHLVLHSGTVGAALTAAALGIPGLAVSIGRPGRADAPGSRPGAGAPPKPHWETAAEYAVAAVDWTVNAEHPIVLNVNVPNLPSAEIRGVTEARLAPYGSVWVASSRAERGSVVLEFGHSDVEPEAGTDLALVSEGVVAVTPLDGIEHAATTGAAESIRRGLHRT